MSRIAETLAREFANHPTGVTMNSPDRVSEYEPVHAFERPREWHETAAEVLAAPAALAAIGLGGIGAMGLFVRGLGFSGELAMMGHKVLACAIPPAAVVGAAAWHSMNRTATPEETAAGLMEDYDHDGDGAIDLNMDQPDQDERLHDDSQTALPFLLRADEVGNADRIATRSEIVEALEVYAGDGKLGAGEMDQIKSDYGGIIDVTVPEAPRL
jgi:hypothetical protein